MNILWITQNVFPEALSLLTGSYELKSTGGWLIGGSKSLVQHDDIRLTVASPYNKVSDLKMIQGEKITYFLFPLGNGNKKYEITFESYWKAIKQQVQPDVVHINGTEFCNGLSYINACGTDKVVVSIQGIRSQLWKYYLGDITIWEVFRNLTFHDLLNGGMLRELNRWKHMSRMEIELLMRVKNVIGRTTWDRAHSWSLNPTVKYYFCNETLRSEFYEGDVWCYNKCKHHSIFLSQAGYPLKALHQVLKAMPYILKFFPDTTIRIAGYDITQSSGLYGLRHFTGYGKYIKGLIKKYHLSDKVSFIGPLNAHEMKLEYLTSNVFICPSSLENSSNSLGEAQMLGVPCLASYVGGNMDMMKGCEENLYRFEDVEMLAYKVCRVFTNKAMQPDMKKIAAERHNSASNSEMLINIYKDIAKI